jgi:hypothetical protein
MQQAAYDDYMSTSDAAGHAARAAIDINYTPMTVSGVPQLKPMLQILLQLQLRWINVHTE